MKVVLDTCALIWAVAEPERLSTDSRTALEQPDTHVYVSPISCAEVACAVERGRLYLTTHWKRWFRSYVIEINQWQLVDIDLPIIEEAFSLQPPFHSDPADRLIVATARKLSAAVVTADQKILQYPHVDSIW